MDLAVSQDLLADDRLVSISVPETETVWADDVVYAADDLRFKTIDGVNQLYKSMQDANEGHDPETDDGTWWVLQGATNHSSLFDGRVQSQTTAEDEIVIVLAPTGRINTLALLNITAREVRYVIEHPEDGVVEDVTVNLTSASGIYGVSPYMLLPIVRKTDIVFPALRWRIGSTLTVTVSDPGKSVGLGVIVVSQARNLGDTRWGATLGFDDYSIRQRDRAGNYYVVEGGYSRRGNFELIVPLGMVDELQRLLIVNRAKLSLFIGDDRYGSMLIYGYVKSCDEIVRSRFEITANLELEGAA